MNIAPDSSLRVEIRPESNEVKKVSGTHVNVCRDVLNLKKWKHCKLEIVL